MSFLRYSILPALLFVFVFTSCSKKDDDASPAIKRTDLVGKSWKASSFEFILDGKAYPVPTDGSDADTWEFKDNGTFVTKYSDGTSEQGKWELIDKKIKLTADGATDVEYMTINKLDAKTLTISLAENIDLTKKPADLTETESLMVFLASEYFTAVKVDMSKSKKLTVNGTFSAK